MTALIADLPTQDLMLILVFIFNIILGIFIFLRNKSEKANIYLSLMAFSTAAWTFGLILFRNTINVNAALFWARFYYVAAIFIGFTFLSFSFAFPFSKKQTLLFYKILFYLFTFVVLLISILPGIMIKRIEFLSWGKNAILEWPYFIYVTYFTMCMVGAFGNFIQKYKISNKIQRLQIKYVFLGIILAAIWGTIFNLYLPLAGNYKLIWLGPYFTLIMVGFLTYAILKHHLLNIKVIATEIFGVLVSVLILVDALLAKTKTEFALKIGLFFAVGFFSYLLIKSVIAEVRTREKIQKLAGELSDANEQLRYFDQEKSDFLSIASHQLRTPMTVIKGYLSMMQEGIFGEFKEEVKNVMTKIYISNERLIKLINELLDISRIERGKMKYNFQKQSFEKVVWEVVNEFKPTAKNKELYFDYEKSESKLTEISFDAEYMRQVIVNLLDNAIKYTNKGGIKISFSTTPQKIILQIRDTGKGIEPKEINKLFRRYQRGLKEGSKGLGMGLYLAKKIIDDHKGKIWAESEGFGKGSTFFVELPAI